MSAAELEDLDEVKGLIARGLRLGVLTYSEIATATSELDLEEGDAEELVGHIFERLADFGFAGIPAGAAELVERQKGLRIK